MAQFLYPPPPALPGGASMSESVVLGLHLFKASEGREYEYLKKQKSKGKIKKQTNKKTFLKMSLWSYN